MPLDWILVIDFNSVNRFHLNQTVVYLMVAERAYLYTLEDLNSVLKETKSLVSESGICDIGLIVTMME